MVYDNQNRQIIAEHFIVSDNNGKLVLKFTHNEMDLELNLDILFDTLMVYQDSTNTNRYCYCGASKGRYQCGSVIIFDEFIEIELSSVVDTYLRARDFIDETHCTERLLNIAASRIDSISQDQIIVSISNRESKGISGQSYALPIMDEDRGNPTEVIHDFLEYVYEHQCQEFILTMDIDMDSKDRDHIYMIFSSAPFWFSYNLLKPMEWCLGPISANEDLNIDFSIAGRHTFDEWIGNLTILYAAHKGFDLGFGPQGIVIRCEDADDLCRCLVERYNSRKESEEQVKQLWQSYKKIWSKRYRPGFQIWYMEFLEERFGAHCSGFEKGSTKNPDENLCKLVGEIVRTYSCRKVYHPFAALGNLSIYCQNVTDQESSSDYSLMARLLRDIRSNNSTYVTGDFNKDWLAKGHDAIVCIPPIDYIASYGLSSESTPWKNAAVNRYRQTLKLLFHKLTSDPRSLRLAVVFVNEDFLYSDEFEGYRKELCEKWGILKNVVSFNKGRFTDVPTGGAMLILDYRRRHDSVSFSQDWLDLWVDYPIDDALAYEKESFNVPVSMIASKHYCLECCFYTNLSSSFLNRDEPDSLDDTALAIKRDLSPIMDDGDIYYADDFNLVPLKDLTTVLEGEEADLEGKTLLCTQSDDFNFTYNRVSNGDIQSMIITEKNDCECYRLFPSETIFITEEGLAYNKFEKDIVFDCSYPKSVAIKADQAKIDTKYLIATLCSSCYPIGSWINVMIQFMKEHHTRSFQDDFEGYITNWCIPIPKGGLETQHRIVAELDKYLQGNQKIYNVIVLGNIDFDLLKKRNLNILEEGVYTQYSKETITRLETFIQKSSAIDAVVIDYNFSESGVRRALKLASKLTKPAYILYNSELNSVLEALELTDDEKKDFCDNNRLNTSIEKLIDCLRNELDYMNSPEAMIRNEYAQEFKAANTVQDAFKPEFDIAKEMELILVETRKQDSRLAERSFDFFRNVRDLILGELVKRHVLPALDKGALASLLTDKVYEHKNGNETDKYYMTGFLMPNNLSAGLQYLTFVSNDAVHNSNGEKDTAMSAVHILFQLLLWAQKKIDEGFFEKNYPDMFYSKKSTYDQQIFNNQKSHIVRITEKAHKRYCYADNVHIFGKVDDLQDGETIYFYQKPGIEKEPFITDDLQIYLSLQNWGKEKPDIEPEKKPEKKTK